MGKTTIDGLAVRTSNSSHRGSSAMRSTSKSVRSMDMTARRKTRPLAQKALAAGSNVSDPLRQRYVKDTFTNEIDDFNAGNELKNRLDNYGSETLGDDSGADWSDLLGELSESKNTSSSFDDFLNDTELSDAPEGVSASKDWLSEWGDESDDFSDDEKRPRHNKRHKKHLGRKIALALVAVVIVAGGVCYKWGDDLIKRLTGGNSGLFDAFKAVVSDEIPFEEDANGRTNVLVFGTEGYNMNGDSGDGQHDGAQLTDSIMVVSFDQDTKDVALLSLPRDLKVPMACSAGKINEVFWCHNQDGTNEEAGAKALMKQIGNILGLEFQYYAHVNWASLIDIINTLGGITVTLDEDINDIYYTGAIARAGEPITVNGEQALGLARARHGTAGGDFTRGNTQQKIVEAIVDKVIHNGIGMNEALGLVNILGDNLRSNFSADNIKAAVRLASGFSVSSIRQVPLVDYNQGISYFTTATINEISYVVPTFGSDNYTQIKDYVAEMLSSNQVVREKAKITVYNATEGYGVASAERERLEHDGYNIIGVGNAAAEDCESGYCIFILNPEKVATQVALEERYGVQAHSAEELPEDILPDASDIIIIVGETNTEEV